MATNFVGRAQKARDARPGGKAIAAGRTAKIAIAVFALLCILGLSLLLAEISTPGMAWYVYR